jgi:hypothetical protein
MRSREIVDKFDSIAVDLDPSEIQLSVDNKSIPLTRLALVIEAEKEHLNHLGASSNVEIFRSIRGFFRVKDDQKRFVIREIFGPGKKFKITWNPVGENKKIRAPFELKSCWIPDTINLLDPPSSYNFTVDNQSSL